MVGSDIETKRIEVLKDAVPAVAKLMILHDPTMGATTLMDVTAVAKPLGLQYRQ